MLIRKGNSVMSNEFKKAPMGKVMFPCHFLNGVAMETASKFNRPTANRRYIKILALCLTYAPASLIYPNTKYPLMDQVRDMCRAGLLERYTKKGSKAYFYKTTRKGRDLISKVL